MQPCCTLSSGQSVNLSFFGRMIFDLLPSSEIFSCYQTTSQIIARTFETPQRLLQTDEPGAHTAMKPVMVTVATLEFIYMWQAFISKSSMCVPLTYSACHENSNDKTAAWMTFHSRLHRKFLKYVISATLTSYCLLFTLHKYFPENLITATTRF